MKKGIYIYIFFVVLALALTAFALLNTSVFQTEPGDAAGFGISPPYIQASDLRPGDTYAQSIRILRSDTGSSQRVTARFDALDIADWFEVFPDEFIIMEPGKKYVRFNFELKVPLDAYTGQYQGKLYFAITPVDTGQRVTVRLGARANININIIDGQIASSDLIESQSQNMLSDNSLVERLQGRFVMRSESRGQIYYLHPAKKQIYYLANAQDFLDLFREEGRGISNMLLNKIPIDFSQMNGDDTDGDGFPDLWEASFGTNSDIADTDEDGFPDLEELKLGFSPLAKDQPMEYSQEITKSVSGFLLLQVENKGQAWYVIPGINRRILFPDLDNSLSVLQDLALGISEENYQKLVE